MNNSKRLFECESQNEGWDDDSYENSSDNKVIEIKCIYITCVIYWVNDLLVDGLKCYSVIFCQ